MHYPALLFQAIQAKEQGRQYDESYKKVIIVCVPNAK